MIIPSSIPTIPVQPSGPSYGFSDLGLFKVYTRDKFQADFGAQAPVFDPTRLIKTWFDSTVDTSDPTNVVIYKVFSQDNLGKWGIRQMVIPAMEAASVNLPGAVTYQQYVIAPTTANRAGVSPIDPVTLSLESQARDLLTELGLRDLPITDEGAGSSLPVNYGLDPRRMWDFNYKGQSYSVGGLLASKNRNGIGAPGHWAIGDTIEWLADPPAPTGLDDLRPPRAMPVRDLLPNEQLMMGLMGPMIVRTDVQQAQQQSNGLFSAADRVMLQSIHDIVAALAQK